MVNVSDIRIGNLVFVHSGAPAPQIEIVTRIDGREGVSVKTKTFPFLTPDDISGVLVTAEWLLKFGFTQHNGSTFYWKEYKEYQLHYTVGYDDLGILPPDGCTGGHTVSFPCKYVHQLQNIYFALTGQELTIKE